MRRFMVLAIAMVFVSAAPNPYQRFFRIGIPSEEAQMYINNPPFKDPQLSGRPNDFANYDDPQFQTQDHNWRNGKQIENPYHYPEEGNNVAQYHGQDGLGAYAYGYRTPQSSKTESRARSGDLSGSYVFRAGSSDELIKVRYWYDKDGFHQEDNLRKDVEPQQEASDLRFARHADEKASEETAAASRKHPQGEDNPVNDNQGQESEQETAYAAAPEPSQAREAREARRVYSGSNYQSGSQFYPSSTRSYYETRPTGPGFFYSFQYPVNTNGRNNQEYSNYHG